MAKPAAQVTDIDQTRTFVKVIHGSNRFWKPKNQQIAWMTEYRDELVKRGFEVRLFSWSGSPLDAFKRRTAEWFLESLTSDLELLKKERRWADSDRICIHAKSLGAEIAERALDLAVLQGKDFECDVLLRIAAPRVASRARAKRVVNISTNGDTLAIGGTLLSLILSRKGRSISESTGEVFNLELEGMAHTDLNHNLRIPTGKLAGKRLYHIYESILLGADPT